MALTMVRVIGKDLPISTKQAVEICCMLRGKPLQKGKDMLEAVITMERPVEFHRFNRDMGHRPGMGPGRYPIKSAKVFLKLLKSLEANAVVQNLDVNSLAITMIMANRASRPWRGGRFRRRKAHKTSIHIEAAERQKSTAPKTQRIGQKK